MTESRFPSSDYKSSLGVWGGKLTRDSENRLVYDNRGVISRIDRFGDAVLRSFDDHIASDPVALIARHPSWMLRMLVPGTKRYRGNTQEILQNVRRLGLDQYYGQHPQGIEIKRPELYTKGRVLQDIYRADLINSEHLDNQDRFEALGSAARYLAAIHKEHGAVGEVNCGCFIFQKSSNQEVRDPVLNLPTVVFNREKNIGEREKKATDVLDFLMSIGVEEYRRSQDWEQVARALNTALENYQDPAVILLVAAFAKRGRLTLQGDESELNLPDTISTRARPVFSQHNKARLGVKESFSGTLRNLITTKSLEHAFPGD